MSKKKIALSLPFPWITRIVDEADRRHGRLRAQVLRRIRDGDDPAPEDVAAALRESAPRAEDQYPVPLTKEEQAQLIADAPRDWRAWMVARITPERRAAAIAERQTEIDADTRDLLEYVCKFIEGRPRRPGRKTRSRTVRQDLAIAGAYFGARAAADSAKTRTRPTDEEIKGSIAEEHGISVRTLERIIGDIKPPARRQN